MAEFSLLDQYPATPGGHVAFIEYVRGQLHHAAEAKRQQFARNYSDATVESTIRAVKWKEARKRVVALSGLSADAVAQVASVLRRELTAGTVVQLDELLDAPVRALRDAFEDFREAGSGTPSPLIVGQPGSPWTPAVFVDRAEELRRRLKVWHVHDPMVPVKVESFLEMQEAIRWQFRTVVMKGEHGPRPAPGVQLYPGLVSGEGAAEGLAGSAFDNLPTDIDQQLTRWLLRDFFEHLADAGTTQEADYLRLKVGRILDAPIYCERQPSGDSEQYLLDERNAKCDGAPCSFVGGQKLDESLLNDLVEAARALLRGNDASADTRIRLDDQIRLLGSEAAKYVGVSDRTIRKWRTQEKLTVLKSENGHLIFSKSELEIRKKARE